MVMHHLWLTIFAMLLLLWSYKSLLFYYAINVTFCFDYVSKYFEFAVRTVYILGFHLCCDFVMNLAYFLLNYFPVLQLRWTWKPRTRLSRVLLLFTKRAISLPRFNNPILTLIITSKPIISTISFSSIPS